MSKNLSNYLFPALCVLLLIVASCQSGPEVPQGSGSGADDGEDVQLGGGDEPADGADGSDSQAPVVKLTAAECLAKDALYKQSTCFTDLGLQENDVKVCAGIPDDYSAINCQWDVDKEKKMPAEDHAVVCRALKEKKDYCLETVAKYLNAADYCLEVKYQGTCIEQVAKAGVVPVDELVATCKKVKPTLEVEGLNQPLTEQDNLCVEMVAEMYRDIDVCKQSGVQMLVCFNNIVDMNTDGKYTRDQLVAWCDGYEETKDLKGLCYRDLGIKLMDIEICKMIEESKESNGMVLYSWREQCLAKVNGE